MSYSIRVNGQVLTGEPLAEWRARQERNKASKLRDMLAQRMAPGLRGTDTQWLAGRGSLRKQFDDDDRYIKMVAERQSAMGHSVRPNDVYLPTLAQYPGDPRAFVSSQAEAVKYANEIGVGLELDGRQVAKAREAEEDPFESAPKLCPKIAHEEAVKLQQADPSLGINEATEMAVEKHGSRNF
jgi:hypothetical protein